MTDSGNDVSIESFVIVRTFAAGRLQVWNAWTDRAHFDNWWGPKESRLRSFEGAIEVGRSCIYSLEQRDGSPQSGRLTYTLAESPERLEYIMSYLDRHGQIIRHPYTRGWPYAVRYTVTLEKVESEPDSKSDGEHTKLTLRGVPDKATFAESANYYASGESLQTDMYEMFDQLSDYLATMK